MIIEMGEGMNEAGESIPAYGFVDHKSGVFITDPYSSSCGRFVVDPVATYGVPKEKADHLVKLNKSIGAA